MTHFNLMDSNRVTLDLSPEGRIIGITVIPLLRFIVSYRIVKQNTMQNKELGNPTLTELRPEIKYMMKSICTLCKAGD